MIQEGENKLKIFEYLDELRASDETNMFGAGKYIQKEFGLKQKEATKLLTEWMETFDERHPQQLARKEV